MERPLVGRPPKECSIGPAPLTVVAQHAGAGAVQDESLRATSLLSFDGRAHASAASPSAAGRSIEASPLPEVIAAPPDTHESDLSAMVKGKAARVRDRSRSVGKTVRAISRTLSRRTGQAKAKVIELNSRAGAEIARSAREARGLAAQARKAARGRGAQAKLRAASKLEELAGRCEKVAQQIDRRARGLKITDRLVSLSDPDARPIRKGKLGRPTEFGFVAQICEVTENTRRGARGFILPAASVAGNPAENRLLATTAAELERAHIRPRELVGDGGFQTGPTLEALPGLAPEQIQLSGRHEPGSRRTRKRRARYRTGIEGRISHLKRGYGLRRSRLKGHDGAKTWTGWAILTYNLDTLAIRTP